MSTETQKVDVLAVIDELIDFEERHAEYERRANYEARDMRAAVAELIEHRRVMREALVKLARAPGCGCSPVCRCGEGDWTRYELEGRMDEAQAALARVGGAS